VIATSKANPSKQAQAVVTVPEITVDVQPSSVTLDQGATQQFTAQVAGTINTGITWNVDPENGGTITENGLYTAPNTPGTYTVIAASAAEPAKRSEAEVTVREISIEIEPSEITLELDEEYQFTAVVRGTVDTGVDWSISPDGMGSITEDGLYTAPTTAGTYTVIATSKADQTKTAEAVVTVSGEVSVSLSPSSISLDQGESYQFTAEVTGAKNKDVVWSIDPEYGGTIDQYGWYRAPSAAGTYYVIATSKANPAISARVTVIVPEIVITIEPSSVALDQGAQELFTAHIYNSPQGVNWSVQPEAGTLNVVDSLRAWYTAPIDPGTYTIIATSIINPAIYATATVTVPEVSITIQPEDITLDQGAVHQFSATLTGTVNKNITWSLDPEDGGTITDGGLYTAPNAAGTYTVIATSVADPTRSAEATVTVPEVEISVTPDEISLDQGGTHQFTFSITGADNKNVTWSATGGTITLDGLYTAPNAAGTYYVTATSVQNPARADQAVVHVPEVSITIEPSSAELTRWPGKTCEFTVTVTGTVDTRVEWIDSEGEGSHIGTVTPTGYTMKPTAKLGNRTLTVRSLADPSKNATAVVNVREVIYIGWLAWKTSGYDHQGYCINQTGRLDIVWSTSADAWPSSPNRFTLESHTINCEINDSRHSDTELYIECTGELSDAEEARLSQYRNDVQLLIFEGSGYYQYSQYLNTVSVSCDVTEYNPEGEPQISYKKDRLLYLPPNMDNLPLPADAATLEGSQTVTNGNLTFEVDQVQISV